MSTEVVPDHKLIRKLPYLEIATRFSITYTIGMLCHFVENPCPQQIIQNLRGTANMELVYSGLFVTNTSTTYSETDFDGNLDNSWSMGGFVVRFGGGTIPTGMLITVTCKPNRYAPPPQLQSATVSLRGSAR